MHQERVSFVQEIDTFIQRFQNRKPNLHQFGWCICHCRGFPFAYLQLLKILTEEGLCGDGKGSFTATAGVGQERAEQYEGKVTTYVIIAWIVAAVGGSIFGYDIGISEFEVQPVDHIIFKLYPTSIYPILVV